MVLYSSTQRAVTTSIGALLASEAEREDVRQARDEWRAHGQPRMRERVHRRLVFLDETGTTTKMTRLRVRARRFTRLKGDVPFGYWATQTFIVGLRCDGLSAPWVIDQPNARSSTHTSRPSSPRRCSRVTW
jgi:hypothetical protein